MSSLNLLTRTSCWTGGGVGELHLPSSPPPYLPAISSWNDDLYCAIFLGIHPWSGTQEQGLETTVNVVTKPFFYKNQLLNWWRYGGVTPLLFTTTLFASYFQLKWRHLLCTLPFYLTMLWRYVLVLHVQMSSSYPYRKWNVLHTWIKE
jgi:hypothetical protein